MCEELAIKSDIELKALVEAAPGHAMMVYIGPGHVSKWKLRVRDGVLEFKFASLPSKDWGRFPMDGKSTWFDVDTGLKAFVNYWHCYGYCRLIDK